MKTDDVRVRFAPSPTGHLHVGGARTAIFNWLFARRHNGKFILRVEDTDQARSTIESETMVLDDLRWLGLDWDEGPNIGGPHEPYRQSERLGLYGRIARELVDRGRAYPCFCDEETLERKRTEAETAGRPPHYDLTCYRLSRDDVARRVDAGEMFVIRFHVPKEDGAAFDADVTINDLIRGEVTWRKESLGDFIVLRSDGMPTYNFSCVVDDHDMVITHVIRAEEHLTNTHRQVLLYRAMGWDEPHFAHVSLILGEDRTKLSKRHGATSVSAYAEEGFLPEAMVNYLTLLGWSPPDGNEIFSAAGAASQFALDRVNSAPAVFDHQKLLWMNGQYIHARPAADLIDGVASSLLSKGLITAIDNEARAWIGSAIELVQKSVHRLPEIPAMLDFVFSFDPDTIVADPENSAVLREEGVAALLETLENELRAAPPLNAEEYNALIGRLKEKSGLKGKKLFMPIRVAIMGSPHGPELQNAVPLLERGSKIASLKPVIAPEDRVAEIRKRVG